jgi:L-alanine-DL-glutamate epimerase-like enolase superfamily enzyme
VSTRTLKFWREQWPIRGGFRIARGEKHQADILVAEITHDAHVGRGECVPYPRYGETYESVAAEIGTMSDRIAAGMTRAELQDAMNPGAARNALDCALIDLEAKQSRTPAYVLLGLPCPKPLSTAFTLSLDEPEAMAEAASVAAKRGHSLLKLKVMGAGDVERVHAVRAEAPHARLIVDANEAWDFEELKRLVPELGRLGVLLIEQPLRAESDEILQDFVSDVPLCADESCHTRLDLARLKGRYQYANIKLDKAGGLTEALALARAANEIGLKLMVGCMVATSLAMAPAMLLGGLAEYVDLDGPLLLERDREPGLNYEGEIVYPPPAALWG